MAPKYRFTPKPGIARTNRVVNTSIKPVILSGQSNIVKTTEAKTPQKHRIQTTSPQKPKKRRTTINRSPKRRRKAVTRASPLRRRKELEIGKYKRLVQNLKNCGQGRILIMVACGPSVKETHLPQLKDHPLIDFMSINRPYGPVFPTKYWVFCDQSQYTRNKELFDNYKGTLINAWSVRARHSNQVLIRNKSGKGFSKDLLQGYYIGRSTTFANMQTAYWMNYDKIYIFGCDMCKPPGSEELHFYGRNQDVDPTIRVKRFAKEAEFYSIGAKQLSPADRQKFVFCSAYNDWPFVKEFQSMDHREAVEPILAEANAKINKNKS